MTESVGNPSTISNTQDAEMIDVSSKMVST